MLMALPYCKCKHIAGAVEAKGQLQIAEATKSQIGSEVF
jgi:hypothetical protein